MIFPVFPAADANAYVVLGTNCMTNLSSLSGIASACHDQVRPVGIILYYAILLKLFPDNVTFSYVVLLINILLTYGIARIINGFFNSDRNPIKEIFIYILVLYNLVCFIPVTMSDLIALYFFLLGIKFFISIDITKPNYYTYLKLYFIGFIFAIDVLLKQPYAAYIMIFLASYCICKMDLILKMPRQILWLTIAFLIGFLPVIIQFIVTYKNYNIFWLYNKNYLIEHNAFETTQQPNIEAGDFVNFLPPLTYGVYMIKLSAHIYEFNFYIYRFFMGMHKSYIMVYSGDKPNVNELIDVSNKTYLFYPYLFLVFYSFISIITFIKSNMTSKILILSAIGVGVFIAMSMNVENRYFIFPRVVFLICIFNLLYDFILNKLKFYKKAK